MLAAGLILLVMCADALYYKDRLYPGATFKGADMGGATIVELETVLDGLKLHFSGPQGLSTSVPLRELGIIADREGIFAAGYRLGRHRPWPVTYYERYKLYREGGFIPLNFHLEEELFHQGLDAIASLYNKVPENARFQVQENGEAWLIPERGGYVIDREMLEQRVINSLFALNTPLTVQVPVQEEIPPKITSSLLKGEGIEALESSFSTQFNLEAANRSHNIRLAASILDNYLLLPGKTLSLNNILGESTIAKGYKEAPIIVGRELVPGLGGGLCQIYSTLYNAALLANLQVIERHSHQLAVPYIDPGRDATVSYPYKDLKILNNKNHSLLFTASVVHDELTISIFGRPMQERVVISTNILRTTEPPQRYEFDPDLAPGEEKVVEGYKGYVVEVWKTVYDGREVITEKLISVDSYSPYPTIIRFGR